MQSSSNVRGEGISHHGEGGREFLADKKAMFMAGVRKKEEAGPFKPLVSRARILAAFFTNLL